MIKFYYMDVNNFRTTGSYTVIEGYKICMEIY